MVSSAIWKKHARVKFFKDDRLHESERRVQFEVLKNSRVYVLSNCTRNHTIPLTKPTKALLPITCQMFTRGFHRFKKEI